MTREGEGERHRATERERKREGGRERDDTRERARDSEKERETATERERAREGEYLLDMDDIFNAQLQKNQHYISMRKFRNCVC